MSYGILHGYAQADTPANYAYGFATLFLQGSAWGTFGGALIGLVLERQSLRTGDWLAWLGSILIGGWTAAFLIVQVLGFDINPPRNNTSIAFAGAAWRKSSTWPLVAKRSGCAAPCWVTSVSDWAWPAGACWATSPTCSSPSSTSRLTIGT